MTSHGNLSAANSSPSLSAFHDSTCLRRLLQLPRIIATHDEDVAMFVLSCPLARSDKFWVWSISRRLVDRVPSKVWVSIPHADYINFTHASWTTSRSLDVILILPSRRRISGAISRTSAGERAKTSRSSRSWLTDSVRAGGNMNVDVRYQVGVRV